jgi:hypothetical protein
MVPNLRGYKNVSKGFRNAVMLLKDEESITIKKIDSKYHINHQHKKYFISYSQRRSNEW